MRAVVNDAVAVTFASYPPRARKKLLALRRLILETAAATEGVGKIEETLKWGEPAYLTSESKSGSTIRLGWKKTKPEQIAIYFNCQTTLVESFRAMFARELSFEGNRAVVLKLDASLPMDALAFCVRAALVYHLRPGRERQRV